MIYLDIYDIYPYIFYIEMNFQSFIKRLILIRLKNTVITRFSPEMFFIENNYLIQYITGCLVEEPLAKGLPSLNKFP